MAQAKPPTATAAKAAEDAGFEKDRTGDAVDNRVADFLHGPLVQTIVMADRKAGILFTLVSAALLYLFTRLPPGFGEWQGLIWLAVVGALVVSAACAFAVIFPRIRTGRSDLLFWGSIAAFPDAESYRKSVQKISQAKIASDKLAYCYDLARICQRKFYLLKFAMIAAAVGLILFLVALATTMPPGGGRLPPIS